jgi:nucleotide-binding universal stress UspA family protein
MYRSILVPLDGSSTSEYVLPIACDIARRSGATLRLAHVHVRTAPDPIYIEGLPVIDEHLQSLANVHERAYLEGVHERLVAEAAIPITVEVLDPMDADLHMRTVPATLAHHAAVTDVDLIVMTTHGRGGVARFWLGSVADVLVRSSPVPILLLRPDEDTPETDRSPTIQRILVPLDGSAQSEAILEHALAFGQLMHAEYTLLSVVAPFVLGASAPFTTPTDFDPDRTNRLEREAQDYLNSVALGLRSEGVQVQMRVLISEQVASSILEEAHQRGSHLIAMSTRGRSGLARLLIGSVADKVLRRAEMPLLLYRPEEHQAEDGRRDASATAEAPQGIEQEGTLR